MLIDEIRSLFAQSVCVKSSVDNEEIREAFASLRREEFLPRGAPRLFLGGVYLEAPSDNAAHFYHDVPIAIDHNLGINNGQPSLHAKCISRLQIEAGSRVVHVGAGSGYYTAILSRLAGRNGKVTAYEYEKKLADMIQRNKPLNVNIVAGSPFGEIIPRADAIYVNAGMSYPHEGLLEILEIGGVMIFPLTNSAGFGYMIRLVKRSVGVFAAEVLNPAAFILCSGADSQVDLNVAGQIRGRKDIRSLIIGDQPDANTIISGRGWRFSSEAV